ncbi:MAG TPA: hypothetical protein VFX16_36290 [Pseudonocardiaceae bacterium]|nr:hypothetical protein [Pseudonocardiaceae bacterium]
MAALHKPHASTAERVLAAISLPTTALQLSASPKPLPLAQLSALPADGSLHYAIASLDTSGRIADRSTVAAMGWRTGAKLNTTVIDGILLIQPAPTGAASVGSKGRLLIPADSRHQAGLTAGDVFIAAAPTAGLVLIHGLWWVDRMLTLHYATVLDTHTAP